MPRGRPQKNKGSLLMKSAELVGWALGGLEREIAQTRNRLASLTAQANQLRARVSRRGGVSSANGDAAASTQKRRRNLSPEARKRISDRMKKRWAEYRKNKAKAKSKSR